MADPKHDGNGNGDGHISLKNERQCARCQRPFWAWDSGRKVCWYCKPAKTAELTRMLGSPKC